MCFRPADAGGGGPMTCPECGKEVQPMGGLVMKKCPFCKADWEKYMNPDGSVNAEAVAAAQAGGAATPGAPGAPSAPGAPKAPGAPGAPKAPGA